jgi:hypothetical protein
MDDSDRLPHRAPSPEEVVGLLADPLRRRIVAALDGRRCSAPELVAAVGDDVGARQVLEHADRLRSVAILDVDDDGRYGLVADVFSRSVRDAASWRIGSANDADAQLARRYFHRNRLVQMPSSARDVEVVLTLIAEDFQPGERYGEREINTTLYGWFGDWALLRRLLVDHGYLARDHGTYWRLAGQEAAATF